MAQQSVNIGTVANDGTGDPLRTAFDKVNQNFTEVYKYVESNTAPSIVTNTLTLNMANNNSCIFDVYWDSNITTLTITNVPTYGSLTLILTQDGVGGKTISIPGSVKQMGAAFSPNTTAGKKTVMTLTTVNGGTTFLGWMSKEV